MSTISPRDAAWREELRKAHTAKRALGNSACENDRAGA